MQRSHPCTQVIKSPGDFAGFPEQLLLRFPLCLPWICLSLVNPPPFPCGEESRHDRGGHVSRLHISPPPPPHPGTPALPEVSQADDSGICREPRGMLGPLQTHFWDSRCSVVADTQNTFCRPGGQAGARAPVASSRGQAHCEDTPSANPLTQENSAWLSVFCPELAWTGASPQARRLAQSSHKSKGGGGQDGLFGRCHSCWGDSTKHRKSGAHPGLPVPGCLVRTARPVTGGREQIAPEKLSTLGSSSGFPVSHFSLRPLIT